MDIKPRNKAAVRAQLRGAMLASCDADIQAIFSEHYYTLEPLLMQMIRELRVLNGIPRDSLRAKLETIVAAVAYPVEDTYATDAR